MRTAPERADTSRPAEERLRRRCPEAHDEFGRDCLELGLEPVPARSDLGRVRLVVDSPFPGWAPLEVLDRVGHVDAIGRDAGLTEQLAQ